MGNPKNHRLVENLKISDDGQEKPSQLKPKDVQLTKEELKTQAGVNDLLKKIEDGFWECREGLINIIKKVRS